mmetsp:Transcript_36660/g.85170  ORF Transcript_36660/g.85170 Transcript_36660/m.85170 type:complete len:205 (+) Transcript_36660:514-1128(+)
MTCGMVEWTIAPVAHTMPETCWRLPSEKTTVSFSIFAIPCGVISARPARTASSVPTSINGGWNCVRKLTMGPGNVSLSPNRSMRPHLRRVMALPMQSAVRRTVGRVSHANGMRRNGTRKRCWKLCRSCMKRRGTMGLGDRATIRGVAPCSTRSSEISAPEFPKPTTRTFFPTRPRSVALVYLLECTTTPGKESSPGTDGMMGSL